MTLHLLIYIYDFEVDIYISGKVSHSHGRNVERTKRPTQTKNDLDRKEIKNNTGHIR